MKERDLIATREVFVRRKCRRKKIEVKKKKLLYTSVIREENRR
jgi:hypothetical protein